MSSNTNNLSDILENLVMPYTDFLTEKGFKEVSKDIDEAIAAILALLPEKQEPKNLHLTNDNGGFLGNYCDTCKIYTFDKDTFEETGAWCLCYPFNSAIDQTRRNLIGEQL